MAALRALAALLLGLSGSARGVTILTRHDGRSPGRRSFRSVTVPYRALVAPRGPASGLPADLSIGDLRAYVPSTPVADDLLVFLPGSGMVCSNYSQFMEDLAGSLRGICLPYDNMQAIGTLCNTDNGCYPDLRLEAFNGSFDGVGGNNIEKRLANALRYLSSSDSASWSAFLDASSGLPLWSRVRLAGHSQGAGAAAFAGYNRKLARVVQLSGVCDRSDWTTKLGPPATPASRFFGLASFWDSMLCPTFMTQIPSWQAEGALPGSSPLHLRSHTRITSTSLGGSHFSVSHLLPPNCSEADMAISARSTLRGMHCDFDAHNSAAVNMWAESPYAGGVWQELCGV